MIVIRDSGLHIMQNGRLDRVSTSAYIANNPQSVRIAIEPNLTQGPSEEVA
ncbi:hypothetical protein PGT21_017826 [Puccinia graminis f. sp. tritici]|uniref:Uncharacterized protein n=1 Tax=Puccinia graminis f. sp. tritici TaxID=56615 RepID=A0A5B0RFP5_PUCGR|nr:hypothetical protein PGT21_017826 [Puccinia graminis f. sp. tritici]KAA1124656.1 hypothetical protein PGTUg99_027026 [Puccinia graminis f. sp. tritici]